MSKWFGDPGPTPIPAGGHDAADVIHAVLEEPRSRLQQQPIPTCGPELAAMMKVGTRVMRGTDWKWGDQVNVAKCKEIKARRVARFWFVAVFETVKSLY